MRNRTTILWILLFGVSIVNGTAMAESFQGDGGVDGETSDDFEGWGDEEDFEESGALENSFGRENADLGYRIHGTFENQLLGMVLNSYNGNTDVVLNNYTRLRLDLDVDLPRGLSIRSDVVGKMIAGETAVPLGDIIPKRTLNALIDENPQTEAILGERFEYKNEYYIDNVYLKVPIKSVVLFLGKQPLEQGVGYVWNPTDVYTHKKIFDPTYEKTGILALRGTLALSEFASIDLIGVPEGEFTDWMGGGRATVRGGPLSISAVSSISRVRRMVADADVMLAAADPSNPDPPDTHVVSRRVLVGGDAVLDISGVRLWTEGAYNFLEKKEGGAKDWLEIVGGVEYYFPSETHVMVEYLHYGAGPLQKNGIYSFYNWSDALSNDLLMLGRDFLFESIDHPASDFWTLGFSSFQSLSDASAAIMGDVRWQFAEDAELWLFLSYAMGQKNDFFSAAQAQGWLRLTAYF